MVHQLNKFFILPFIIFFLLLFGIVTPASSEETYKFERMWPTLQQPWYFHEVIGIAISKQGNVYVADQYGDCVRKYTLDGYFVSKWGKNGSGDGEFNGPKGIAVDNDENVYVADRYNYRIQKFDANGSFITEWASGSGSILGIAVDNLGYVYVTCELGDKVNKFTPGGVFVESWINFGSSINYFEKPQGIAAGIDGTVYVVDSGNDRIVMFDPEGTYVGEWGDSSQFGTAFGIAVDKNGYVYTSDYQAFGTYGVKKFSPNGEFITGWGGDYLDPDGYFNGALGIALDSQGFIYVTEMFEDRIQKLSADGDFIGAWATSGREQGKFDTPFGIASTNDGYVYVVDYKNNRIQKFNDSGDFVLQWGGYGIESGKFDAPKDVAVDSSGNVYVTDYANHRVQKFNANGQYLAEWGIEGSGGTYWTPYGITIDSEGKFYVTSYMTARIYKFNSSGVYLETWGGVGSDLDIFSKPTGIAVDGDDNIYVADILMEANVFKLSADGTLLKTWGDLGSGDGQFKFPDATSRADFGITTDTDNNVYVVDTGNHRVQKFDTDGNYLGKWGSQGSAPGDLYFPGSIDIASNGKIYVTDTLNHRIQVFKKILSTSNNKAIIVSGGGSYAGNNLWDATQMSANFAYRTLTYQGFTKEDIYYLTSDTDLDLDSNGILDDVDADATNSNLEYAIKTWASDAESLVVYLVDHGGEGTFRMSGTQTLDASALDAWLDQLQETLPGKAVVIYDACESGSFISYLTTPTGKERVVVTSTSTGESAYFVTQGSVSFSNYFWTHIFNGLDIKDAFSLTEDALGFSFDDQHPLLDSNGNGAANETEDLNLVEGVYIGNGTVIQGDAPVIGSVSSDPSTISGTSTSLLTATGVTDSDGIARVWAVIRPPDYNQGSSDNPVQELPSVDLTPAGADAYEGTYDSFNIAGTYQIAIYARDRMGNTSIPKLTTVTVENPLSRKAIIVVGGDQTDDLWPAIEKSAELAYESLLFQGYRDSDIYFFSNVTFSAGVDGSTTHSNLDFAVNTWAGQNSYDLVLYMVGKGSCQAFELNASEELSATELDGWLDNLQAGIPGRVVVVYDASLSGSFLPHLTPGEGKERILISSSTAVQPAYFISEGDISFSRFFWQRVLNGTNVRDAFINAKNSMWYASRDQMAQLDDNGNGIGNEKPDGVVSKYYTIGVGIMLAGDDPIIGSVCPGQEISATSSAVMWAEDVTTTGTIEKVWAVISSGQAVTELSEVELTDTGSGHYEGTCSGFNNYGRYEVAVYAKDTEGNVSIPAGTWVFRQDGPDIFEEDDTLDDANPIILNNDEAQRHNFHDSCDQDWVKFYGVSGQTYSIKASNLGTDGDVVLELYDSDGVTLLDSQDTIGDPRADELLEWPCTEDGMYFVKVYHYNSNTFGENTGYDLTVYRPSATVSGFLAGSVYSSDSQDSIEGAIITTDGGGSALSLEGGGYLMVHSPGTFTITAEASGFHAASFPDVSISEGAVASKDLGLEYLDTDSDDMPDIWEKQYPGWVNWQVNDASLDPDGDGLNNLDEYLNSADPGLWDTDNDGMPDGWEVSNGLDPNDATGDNGADGDPDNDGWSNLEEYQRGTLPDDPASHPSRAMPWIMLLLDE